MPRSVLANPAILRKWKFTGELRRKEAYIARRKAAREGLDNESAITDVLEDALTIAEDAIIEDEVKESLVEKKASKSKTKAKKASKSKTTKAKNS